MLRSSLALGLVAVLVSAFSVETSPQDTPLATVVAACSDHTVTIQYLSSRGLWRPAKISVQSRPGARTPWRGDLQSVRLDGLQPLTDAERARWNREGQSPTAWFRSPSSMEAEVLAPAPENIQRIWFQASEAEVNGVLIWTEDHNPTTVGGDEPPKDSDTEEGDGDDDGDDSDDDDSTWGSEEEWGDDCPRPGNDCIQYDMVTCTCVRYAESDDSSGDSWSSPAEMEGPTMMFRF